jgi:hypothetical protein
MLRQSAGIHGLFAQQLQDLPPRWIRKRFENQIHISLFSEIWKKSQIDVMLAQSREVLMENLARGWSIVMAHWHHHSVAVWIAILPGAWVAISASRRRQNEKDADDGNLRPKRRPPLPRSTL